MYTKYTNMLLRPALVLAICYIVVGCEKNMIELPPPEVNTLQLIKSVQYRQSSVVPESVALDSMVKYLDKYPDLDEMLQSNQQHTLFAPSNKAFKQLLENPVFKAIPGGLDEINSDILKTILSYHILLGKYLEADILSQPQLISTATYPLSPADFQKITVNPVDSTLWGGEASPSASIRLADGLSINGVVYVIESVLLPPSTDLLKAIIGTLAFDVATRREFSRLAQFIQHADSGFQENESQLNFKIQTLLTWPDNSSMLDDLGKLFRARLSPTQPKWAPGITFFALPNSIINAIGAVKVLMATASPAEARRFLLNHIILGKYKLADLKDGLILYTMTSGIHSIQTSPSILRVVSQQPSPPLDPLGLALRTASQSTAYVQNGDLETSNGGTLHILYGDLQPR